MRLLYGTGNTGKLNEMKRNLQNLPITLLSLKDFEFVPNVQEEGETPLENAILKAQGYFDVYKMPCFSCDSALYFENVKEEHQPGVYARRVQGKTLSDEEMIEYYSTLAKQYGRIKAQYRNGICLIMDEKTSYCLEDNTIGGIPFYLVSTPHKKRVQGFPLDSISTDEEGRYYFDMQKKVDEPNKEFGFPRFFKNALEDYFRCDIKDIQ